jgi:RHS repeat-associated protein
VVRTGATTSYSFEIPDQQGTNELYLDNTAQIPIWRQFTPYGAPRGATVAWIDNRGFLNKPADPDTGLDYIGARAYDPQTAQFISPDPVLVTGNPQDLDPYDYAEDNPETNEDPSGQLMCIEGGPCGSRQYLESWSSDQQQDQVAPAAAAAGVPWVKYNNEHNAAVAASMADIAAQIAMRQSITLAQAESLLSNEFYIRGGSKAGTGNGGRADIVWTDSGPGGVNAQNPTYYVWEVKANGYTDAAIIGEVNGYVKQMRTNGQNARPGFALSGTLLVLQQQNEISGSAGVMAEAGGGLVASSPA